jgi:hypothetical protein
MKQDLEESLKALRKKQVRRTAFILLVWTGFGSHAYCTALLPSSPSPPRLQFDIIFLNPSLIDKEAQAEIHRLQPKAVVFYTVSSFPNHPRRPRSICSRLLFSSL